MSLFDRYFSQKNKDYIFNLLCSTFEREKGQSFMNNRAFKEHYQMIYPRVFDRSASDDLVSLNKELIDAMDECISNEKFTNHGQRSNFHNPKIFTNLAIISDYGISIQVIVLMDQSVAMIISCILLNRYIQTKELL